jgi:hypothetical protein
MRLEISKCSLVYGKIVLPAGGKVEKINKNPSPSSPGYYAAALFTTRFKWNRKEQGLFLYFNFFQLYFFIEGMHQAICQANLWYKDFFCICPSHYIDVDKQGRYNHIRPVFP